ncbi:MAG: hypothetical protein LBU34_08005 [Planctomycetaceae bacterium]|nr:hypothetical protein [Planctomycetaceae bacterium]
MHISSLAGLEGNHSPVLRLTIHKVGNRSPNGCVGFSRQIFVSTPKSSIPTLAVF